MKVLALNSSPRVGGLSKSEMMLGALVSGMEEAGARVEVVDLRKRKIKNCIGCFTCWTKTPGRCIQKDDMTEELFPRWTEADIAVYATPIYHWTMNATMKTFIERTLPVVEPFFIRREGRWTHPVRKKHPRNVMLAVAAFPEDAVFSILSANIRHLFGASLIAEIYRGSSEMMVMPAFKERLEDILAATAKAGEELARSGRVSDATMARIKQPVGDFDAFAQMGNVMWKTCITEGVTPKEMEKKGIVPRPDSLITFMLIMQAGFNPAAAGDSSAKIQFDFSGEVAGSCFFTIAEGECIAQEGRAEAPDLTIEAPFEVWMDVICGKADAMEMFQAGKCRAKGDVSGLRVFG